jgi:hypothetical protein
VNERSSDEEDGMKHILFGLAVLMTVFLVIHPASAQGVQTSPQTSQSALSSKDLAKLEGRWEGTMTREGKSSYYGMEVFSVNTEEKNVKVRRMCPECPRAAHLFFMAKLDSEKGTFNYENSTFGLQGGRLKGKVDEVNVTFDLGKLALVKTIPDAKILLGKWIMGTWGTGHQWWELTIQTIDPQKGTFTGKHWAGWGMVYELTDAKIIRTGERLAIEFKTAEGNLTYRLDYYPPFDRYPQVLWGKLSRSNGSLLYPMFTPFEEQNPR